MSSEPASTAAPCASALLDCGILRLVGELENATGRAHENWQRLKKAFELAEAMAKATRPGQWLCVKRCDRDEGRWYFVRRVWNDNRADDPCLAEWTKSGWVQRWGHLTQTTQSGATIEQWCWE